MYLIIRKLPKLKTNDRSPFALMDFYSNQQGTSDKQ